MSKKKLTSEEKVDKKTFDNIRAISTDIVNIKDKFKVRFTRCYICGEFLNLYTSNIDHVIPKIEKGLDSVINKKYVHTRCNLKKGGKDIFLEKEVAVRANVLYSKATVLEKKLLKIIFNIDNVANLVISLNDYFYLQDILKLYRLPYFDYKKENIELSSKMIGYVPKGSILCKLNKGYILEGKVIYLLTQHLTENIINNIEEKHYD